MTSTPMFDWETEATGAATRPGKVAATSREAVSPTTPGENPGEALADVVMLHAKQPSKEAKPFVEQYIALPGDLFTLWNQSKAAGPDAPEQAGRRVNVSKYTWLLAALLRMSSQGIAVAHPEELAAASGWSVDALRRWFNDASSPTSPWVRYQATWGDGKWVFAIAPPRRTGGGGFLKVPAWWLWLDPDTVIAPRDETEGLHLAIPEVDHRVQRWQRRFDSPASPALLAMLAFQRIAHNHVESSRYGARGLATIAGVSVSTVERGLRDARNLGYLATTYGTNGTHVTRRVRLHPGDPVGDIGPDGMLLTPT